jgi:hypothetical protein
MFFLGPLHVGVGKQALGGLKEVMAGCERKVKHKNVWMNFGNYL